MEVVFYLSSEFFEDVTLVLEELLHPTNFSTKNNFTTDNWSVYT